MSESRPSVRVNIFNKEYLIKGDADVEYIESLARYVDAKMREIAGSTTLSSELKVSILAAVNITDELHRLKKEHKTEIERLKTSYEKQKETLALELEEQKDRLMKSLEEGHEKKVEDLVGLKEKEKNELMEGIQKKIDILTNLIDEKLDTL